MSVICKPEVNEGKLTACLIAGGPLPKFDGITAPTGPPQAQAQAQAQPLQAQNSGPIRVPPLTPDKVAQYSSLFEESGAQDGMLSGNGYLVSHYTGIDC